MTGFTSGSLDLDRLRWAPHDDAISGDETAEECPGDHQDDDPFEQAVLSCTQCHRHLEPETGPGDPE